MLENFLNRALRFLHFRPVSTVVFMKKNPGRPFSRKIWSRRVASIRFSFVLSLRQQLPHHGTDLKNFSRARRNSCLPEKDSGQKTVFHITGSAMPGRQERDLPPVLKRTVAISYAETNFLNTSSRLYPLCGMAFTHTACRGFRKNGNRGQHEPAQPSCKRQNGLTRHSSHQRLR